MKIIFVFTLMAITNTTAGARHTKCRMATDRKHNCRTVCKSSVANMATMRNIVDIFDVFNTKHRDEVKFVPCPRHEGIWRARKYRSTPS